MTMIERVAEAIRKADAEQGLTYSQLTEKMARAAIAAMREPADSMKAVIKYDSHDWMVNNWREMIDIALFEADASPVCRIAYPTGDLASEQAHG